MSLRYRIGMLVALVALGGCYNVGAGNEPLVFPNEGRAGSGSSAGSTVAMMIDSNYLPVIDQDEWHDISPDRVEVWVRDEEAPVPAFDVQANVRAVFDLAPDSWSVLNFVQPGITGTVVIFDLPSDDAMGSPPYGHDVSVYIRVDGAVPTTSHTFTERNAPFYITGTGGTPQELMEDSLWIGQESWLERPQHAVIRLRAKRSAFSAGQQLGSIEFDIKYNLAGSSYEGCVDSVLGVRPRSEAKGLALVSDAVSGVQHVALVSPKGFQLTFISEGYFDDTLAGEGPFLDLLVQQGTPDCDLTSLGWFEIRDLTVTDLAGQELVEQAGQVVVDSSDAPLGNAVFRAYLIDPS